MLYPPDATLDIGEFSTIRKSPRNTNPVARPQAFGDVIHMDIVFGPEVAIGNVHYGLLFTDRFSRQHIASERLWGRIYGLFVFIRCSR